jgi:peptide/nickel transport system substrate-binding protein
MRSRSAWIGGAGCPGRLLVLLVSGMVVLAGCAPAGPAASPASQDSPRVAGPPKILRLDNRKESTTGMSVLAGNNGSQRETQWTFHAGMTAYDAQNKLVGRLAAKVPSVSDGDWKVNADGTMDVTWRLRPNVTWHDGTSLTAADVAFGYELYMDRDLPVNRTGAADSVSGTTVLDPQTLVVHWKQPYFNANVSDLNDVPPAPVHIVGETYKADKQQLISSPYWFAQFIGLGPYRLVHWEQGSYMEGQAFDKYVLGRPKIDRVILRFTYDPNVSLASLMAGDLDIVPQGVSSTDRETLIKNPQLTVLQWPSGMLGAILQWRDPTAPWVGGNTNTSAFGVRQAMMHLLDRQLMAETFEPGGSGVVDIFVVPADPVYKLVEARGITKLPYDPTRAAQLFANAGWTKGPDGMLRNSAGQGFPFEVREAATPPTLSYIEMLRKGGIDAWLSVISPSALNRMEERAKSQGSRVEGGAIAGDFIAQFISKEVRSEANNWSGLNQGGYVNPDIDRLYAQYVLEFDVGKRNELSADFHKFVADQALRQPWYYGSASVAFKNELSGPVPLPPALSAQAWNIQEWDLK